MAQKDKNNSDGIRLQRQPRPSTRVIRLAPLKKPEPVIMEEEIIPEPPVKTFIPEPKADFFEKPIIEAVEERWPSMKIRESTEFSRMNARLDVARGNTEFGRESARPSPEPMEVRCASGEDESAAENIFTEKFFEHASPQKEHLIRPKKKRLPRGKKFGIWTGAVSFLAIVILLSTVFASLTVTFKPRVESLSLQNIVTTLDTSVSQVMVASKIIPAELLEFSKKISKTFPTTATKYVEEKASGKVKIYNGYSSSPQKLVSSTRFVTDNGAIYRLVSTVTVPGATIEEGQIKPKFLEAALAADQPGESFNTDKEIRLKIAGFKGNPKYDGFYAVAGTGFNGGFKGNTKVVSKDDLKKAQEQVTKQAYEELKTEMDKKIPVGFKLVDGLREIQIVKMNYPPENIRADTFAVEAGARGRVLIFKESDMVYLSKELLLKDVSSLKLLEDSAAFSYQVQNADFNKGKAAVALNGSIKTQAQVMDSDLAQILKGQKEGSINEFLKNRAELADFRTSFFPPWISSAPGNPSKIKFKQE